MRTPFFTGSNQKATHRLEARRVAKAFALENPDVGYSLAFSAASFVLRDGRKPTTPAVLDEARRRYSMLQRAVARRNH